MGGEAVGSGGVEGCFGKHLAEEGVGFPPRYHVGTNLSEQAGRERLHGGMTLRKRRETRASVNFKTCPRCEIMEGPFWKIYMWTQQVLLDMQMGTL